MKYVLQFLCATMLWFMTASVSGQSDKALLRELAEENTKSVEALALYPSDTRLAILESCKYPEALIKMNNTREKTAAAFRTLIEDFPRPTQEVFYELTRYPGLVEKIVSQQGASAEIKQLLKQLPENQRDDAFDLVQNQGGTLKKINDLDHTARAAIDDLLSGYSAPAQSALRKLVALPEVLDLLNQDLRFTVLVGDVYQEDPGWVIRKTDSLNLAVARTQAQELEDWKKEIENDPQAQKDLDAASKEYAAENGYDDSDTEDYPYDDLYDNDPEYTARPNDYYYPWWFGYPWWYTDPCWRPYPYWYHRGFYHRHQTIVIVYLPSWHFVDWYFHHPHHHYHYTNLSTHFVNHYYGHRRSGTSISMGVGDWRNRNRTVISDKWLEDKAQLPGRLKEFGRFEEGRQEYNARNPKAPLTQEQFLDRNGRKYPEVSRSRDLAKTEQQREQVQEQKDRSKWAPDKEPVRQQPATQPKTRVPAQREEPKVKTERPPTDKPRAEPVKPRPIEEAKDYHRNKWEEDNRTAPKQQPAPAKTQPAKPQAKPPAKTNEKPRSNPPAKTQKSGRSG